uniref:Ribosomal RNA-processing protein 43 n=1 Tax=Falco tinnunculus TaxID=100819 RepID=A0A8C4UVV5_FALTI
MAPRPAEGSGPGRRPIAQRQRRGSESPAARHREGRCRAASGGGSRRRPPAAGSRLRRRPIATAAAAAAARQGFRPAGSRGAAHPGGPRRRHGDGFQNGGTIGILQKIFGSITTADGSALVKLGNTTVVCGVKAELAAPAVDSANKGYIVPNVELPSLCSTKFRSGPPGEEAQAASQFIADVIENSQIIAKEDLCIANGKLAWVLYCDIICLDYDGNILDASAFALLAALKNVQLPSVTINEETGLSEVNLKQKNPLVIRKHPVATSFAIFDDTLLIVDPTAEEEDLASGTVTVVTDEEGRLCSVHKPGGSPLTGDKLQDCITRAITRHKEVKKLIDKVIKSIKPK